MSFCVWSTGFIEIYYFCHNDEIKIAMLHRKSNHVSAPVISCDMTPWKRSGVCSTVQ